jgi:hypothetical protein
MVETSIGTSDWNIALGPMSVETVNTKGAKNATQDLNDFRYE